MGEIPLTRIVPTASTEVPVNSHSDGHINGSTNDESTTNGTRTSAENSSPTSYQILEEPTRSGRPIKVIIIGAGASALNFAHDVDTSPLKIDLTCYEKNPEIGGTW